MWDFLQIFFCIFDSFSGICGGNSAGNVHGNPVPSPQRRWHGAGQAPLSEPDSEAVRRLAGRGGAGAGAASGTTSPQCWLRRAWGGRGAGSDNNTTRRNKRIAPLFDVFWRIGTGANVVRRLCPIDVFAMIFFGRFEKMFNFLSISMTIQISSRFICEELILDSRQGGSTPPPPGWATRVVPVQPWGGGVALCEGTVL